MPAPPTAPATDPERVAVSLLSCLGIGEIQEQLNRGLVRAGERSYTIVFRDSRSGELSPYLVGPETDPVDAACARALEDLPERDGSELHPLGDGLASGSGALPAVAAATLSFGEERYGLFLLHARERPALRPWTHLVEVLGSVLIKAQLYEAASQEAATSRSKLAALNEAGELVKYVDLEVLLAKLMEMSIGIMNAQVGAIVLKRDEEFQNGIEWGLSEELLLSLRTRDGDSFVQDTLERGEPLLIENVNCSDRIDARNLEVNLQSLLAVPLLTQATKLGLIVIVNAGADDVGRENFEVLSTIANLAASALESAILHQAAIEHERVSAEMDLASTVQTSLLPGRAPELDGIELAGWNMTCTETGGDYFDYIDLGEGRTAIVVGDGTGHGMGAALMMFITRSTLRALLTHTRDLVDVLETMNDLIEQSSEPDRFMTLFLGVIDETAQKITYASAGHDPPIVHRPGERNVVELESTGIPLGVLPGSRYSTREIELKSGDFWLFGTDGIWEARNQQGTFYGKERLFDLVREVHGFELPEASERIRRDILDFHEGAEQMDDITAVLMKVV